MQAFAIENFGETGSVRELPDPKPEAGEVLVRVQTAGVNVVDGWVLHGALKDMMEHRFPLIPGVEAAGVVESIGSDVGDFAEGDRVNGVSLKPFFGSGTFAELATLPAEGLATVPASLDWPDAAALPHTGLTALAALDAVGQPLEGKKILVVGSTGGVGCYLTQLAASRGAQVIAVTRDENLDYARSLGATETIDYTKGDLLDIVRASHPEGVDAVVDFFSDGPNLTRLSQAVRRDGKVVSASGGADPEVLSPRGIEGINVSRSNPARLAELTNLVESGELKVPPIHVFPLRDAAMAIAEMQGRHVRGKLVIQPG